MCHSLEGQIIRFSTHVEDKGCERVKNASLEMTSFMDGPARYMEAGRLVFFMSKSGAPRAARCHNQASARRCCYIGHTCGWYRSYIHTEELRRTELTARSLQRILCRADCAQFNIKYTCKPIAL